MLSTSVERLSSKDEDKKPIPHAVCVPFPTQGHINPMLKLAKLLHHKGFHITFVNTEFNHRRLLKSQALNSSSDASFHFKTIPDGLPPSSDPDTTQEAVSLLDSTAKNCLLPFRELLRKLNDDSAVPFVTCIFADCAMTFTVIAAEELGIPNVGLWTASACSYLAFFHFRHLVERGIIPLKDVSYLTNGYLDMVIDWIPGISGIRLKDMPTFLRTTDPNDIMLNYLITENEKVQRCSALIFNTFDDLDRELLEAISSMANPLIYTVGPLQLLLDQVLKPQDKALDVLNIGSNLWKEETECLEWLGSKRPNSVVLVNFGSITVITAQQLIEFAWGLANSGQTFLWIVRPDLVIGTKDSMETLLKDFLVETKERGLMASWCPQEKVLSHPSIGGFLTHNGWNSTLESIYNGVPMICWPFFADQQTNCWLCCTKWGIGMEIDNNVKREQVEWVVRELMEGEKGQEMRKKAMEWRNMAHEATLGPSGSSFLNLDKMINQVLLSPNDV